MTNHQKQPSHHSLCPTANPSKPALRHLDLQCRRVSALCHLIAVPPAVLKSSAKLSIEPPVDSTMNMHVHIFAYFLIIFSRANILLKHTETVSRIKNARKRQSHCGFNWSGKWMGVQFVAVFKGVAMIEQSINCKF